jgi:hypothetical protein
MFRRDNARHRNGLFGNFRVDEYEKSNDARANDGDIGSSASKHRRESNERESAMTKNGNGLEHRPRTTTQKDDDDRTSERKRTNAGSRAKRWFWKYFRFASFVFLITCAFAFAEFAYERLIYERSEIAGHEHGKKLFIGAAVSTVTCWVLLLACLVMSW